LTPARIVSEHIEMVKRIGPAKNVPRRTLVVCNTVRKARILFAALTNELTEIPDRPELLLLHSRFRREDREAIFKQIATVPVNSRGQVIVATQVIEAGVDISSATLWMEAAPLPSAVQRLGRLNRAGEFGHNGALTTEWTPKAFVVGIGVEPPPEGKREKAEDKKKREDKNVKRYLPYGAADCEVSLRVLANVSDASPTNLETALAKPLADALKPPTGVLQRHELLDFFDTDANLSLGYTDVTPFVRGLDPDTDVQVLWRNWEPDAPPFGGDIGAGELCPVPLWDVTQLPTWRRGFIWQGCERGWQPANERNVFPGVVLLLPTSAGGYSPAKGWTGDGKDNAITDLYEPPELPSDDDLLSLLGDEWASIGRHTQEAKDVLKNILEFVSTGPAICAAMLEAMDWHDFGKNHPEWQAAVVRAAEHAGVAVPTDSAPFAKFSLGTSPALIGKSGRDLRKEVYRLKYTFRPGLRHEVASAIALRQYQRSQGRNPNMMELLAEYIVMSHHGRVRKVLREELPKSPKPGEARREEVRGIVDGVQIGAVTVGDRTLTAGPLSIECRKLGRCQDGSEGWTKGVLRLLDDFGPFLIAYYEALFRAADWRASSKSSE
jgi:CRISPR-associated endonuclease/helicase Cas3